MKFAITNRDYSLFLTGYNGQYNWTDNINLAYVFNSEIEAAEYEENSASYFLQFGTNIFSYISDVSHLLTNVLQ